MIIEPSFSIETVKEQFCDRRTGAVIAEKPSSYVNYIKVHYVNDAGSILYSNTYRLTTSPFANCQTSAIANFAAIINVLSKDYNTSERMLGESTKTDDEIQVRVNDFMAKIKSKAYKCQFMVDVHDKYCEFIDKYFPAPLFKSSYQNNTGSLMTTYLLKFP